MAKKEEDSIVLFDGLKIPYAPYKSHRQRQTHDKYKKIVEERDAWLMKYSPYISQEELIRLTRTSKTTVQNWIKQLTGAANQMNDVGKFRLRMWRAHKKAVYPLPQWPTRTLDEYLDAFESIRFDYLDRIRKHRNEKNKTYWNKNYDKYKLSARKPKMSDEEKAEVQRQKEETRRLKAEEAKARRAEAQRLKAEEERKRKHEEQKEKERRHEERMLEEAKSCPLPSRKRDASYGKCVANCILKNRRLYPTPCKGVPGKPCIASRIGDKDNRFKNK